MAKQYHYFLSTPRRLEALVVEECKVLGAKHIKESPSGVHATGTLEFGYKACMWSRVANSVLLRIGRGPARDTDALYESASKIAWEEHFDVRTSFVVSCTLGGTTIDHDRFAMLRVKDAIVDRFRERFNRRPSVDREEPGIYIHVHIHRDEATFYLDISGPSLHQRGYREEHVTAPLKENVAAAILLRANWPEIARRGGALVDPMCGSGTFAIEAALIAGDRAPGLTRWRFGFEQWKHHDSDTWKKIMAQAQRRAERGTEHIPTIIASDHDPKAVRATRINVANANLEDIRVKRSSLQQVEPPQEDGLFVVNPPYGERLGEDDEVLQLHKQLGWTMRDNFLDKRWRAAVLTLNRDLGRAICFRASKVQAMDNGKLDCLLLQFDLTEKRLFIPKHQR